MALSQCCEQFGQNISSLISGSNRGLEREVLPWHCHSIVSSFLPVLLLISGSSGSERGCHGIVTVL